MGNSTHLQFVQEQFPPNTYQSKPYSLSSSNASRSIGPYYLIDTSHKIIGQKHSIREFNSLQFELKFFAFRKQYASCLVTVHDIILGQTPSVIMPDCMVNEHNRQFTVVLERIPYRLADIGVIKFAQMTHILQQSFRALHLLAHNHSRNYFIDQDMICFNTEGKCKLWINQNLAKNTPNISAVFTQQTIITHLFQILESRLDLSPPESYYRSKDNYTFTEFSQAFNFIQKTRKKLRIQTNFIQSLKIDQTKIFESDSTKANNQNRNTLTSSQEKRSEKFSLKNSRNYLQNKSNKPPKTVLSRQQTTQVSMVQIEKRNIQEMDLSRFMRSSFKSVNQKKKSIHFTDFSEKVKRKISPKNSVEKQEKQKQMHCLSQYKKFPKGPLFN